MNYNYQLKHIKQMSYTERTTQSYSSRLGGSLKGMLTGFMMFLGATALLWWNEGRTVAESDAIKDAEKNFVEMDNPKKIDPSLDGELVYACEMAETNDTLEDSFFGIRTNAINMTRKVQYYQWKEEEHKREEDKMGGSKEIITNYTYNLEWTDSPINSSNFHDPNYQRSNTVLTEMKNETWSAENVKFGAYTLPLFVIEQLYASESFNISADESKLRSWEKSLNPDAASRAIQEMQMQLLAKAVSDKSNADSSVVNNDSASVPAKIQFETEYVHVSGNQIYLGKNPGQPNVGDVRITYTKCSPTKCSLIAKVKGDTFTRYKTKNGKMFSLVQKGVVESDVMIQNAKDTNNMIKWGLRLLGLFLIYVGLRMLLGFPEALLKVLPVLSSILGVGVGIICLLLTIIWGGLVIAIAWFYYRPILSICILAVVAAAAFALWKYKKKAKPEVINSVAEQ